MDCFVKLPAEIKFQIFEQLDSLSDAASLVGASPSVRACYQENRDKLLRHNISYIREIFYNDELIPLALMVARMRRRLKRRQNMDQLVELLEDYVRGGKSKLFRRKFDDWEENLRQIQDLVNISTEILELCPRPTYEHRQTTPLFYKPLLSRLWHHRFVETYLREEISTTTKRYDANIMFPPKENLSPKLYEFLFTPNLAGSRLPGKFTTNIVDMNVAICRFGNGTWREVGFSICDPMYGLGISRERKHQIQSWRDDRRKAWEEEDRKAQIGQMVVYNGCGELLRADELI
ncbi:uncharacterized protein FTJAE_3499 [Fusarium tjaetaba]|uniref:F-box domain-containing protein n=1 Tax=Fusarium tjaetaba TaxID=1567544 RepID=A0A8H5W2C5_9HYPO|nr:uncharacterized protein FTJAE_3499 [Fusarium tjaetaba]KAF5642783.1 hypothetical protein FTJAE_3499 [Fusarium tjaetaba]